MIGRFSLTELLIYIVAILISLTIHEFMHAYTGYLLGDQTAKAEGRVSLNPLQHIDPLMTVALPILTLIFFGAPILAAKPVPFDPRNLKYEEFGAAILAAAGPLSNLVLAVIGAVLFKMTNASSLTAAALGLFITLNVSLFIFNMIPIPPLDGSRVLYAFAPESLQRLMMQIEPYGLFIVFFLVLGSGGAFSSFLMHANNFILNQLP